MGATCLSKFRSIAGLCATRKVLGYVWLMSLPPLRYERVQTAFVPKTHADAGLAAGREKGVRSRGSSNCLKGKKTTEREPVLDGTDCCNLEWKLHESTLAPESPVIFTMIMELVLRDLKKLDYQEKGVETGRLYADDVVLVTASVAAAEVIVTEVIAELKVDCWCTENTLDEPPEDGRREHHGRRMGCVVGGCPGVCGIEGVFRRERKTRDRVQISSTQQVSGEKETCFEFFMASENFAPEHCKDYNALELERLDDCQSPKGPTLRV